MHRLVLLASLVIAVAPAHASRCGIEWRFLNSVPIGCPLTLYVKAEDNQPPGQLVARRAGQEVDVTASQVSSTMNLEVQYDHYDCDDQLHQDLRSEPYWVHTYEMSAAAIVGDQLYAKAAQLGDYGPIAVIDAAPCETYVPSRLVCYTRAGNCFTPDAGVVPDNGGGRDDGGCSSSGSAPMIAGLFVLPIYLGRRRRLR